jgi:hypothetical protein
MPKLLTLLIASGCLGLTLPCQAQPTEDMQKPDDRVTPPPQVSKDYLKKFQDVELVGTLEWANGGPDLKWAYTHYTGYQIRVNGVAYQLPLFGAKTELLTGKRVRVRGRLTVCESVAGRLSLKWPVPMDARIFVDHSVSVASFEVLDAGSGPASSVRITEKWEVRGKLLEVRPAPKSMGYVGLWAMVEVNGRAYWLDFGRDVPMLAEGGLEKSVRPLVGQTIVVTGTYGPRGIGGGPEAIHVESLRPAGASGAA